MRCTIDTKEIQDTIAFHGHSCPGLAIGIRAVELARRELNLTPDSDVVCVTETDMCGVDAIQFLTPCTYGKGNLVHWDYGKAGFTFFDRKAGRGFRALFLDHIVPDDPNAENPKAARTQAIMAHDLAPLFEIKSIDQAPVRGARILNSMVCADCGERVMESRIRRFAGKDLCIPCFRSQEQKI